MHSDHFVRVAQHKKNIVPKNSNQWFSLAKITLKMPMLARIVHWWPTPAGAGRGKKSQKPQQMRNQSNYVCRPYV
jgi:hypothetical protein